LLQSEFFLLKKRYWGRHFWAIGYDAWSIGTVTDEMIQEYLEHHCPPNSGTDNMILE
jgi:putative transposase